MEQTVYEKFQNKGYHVRFILDLKDMITQSATYYKYKTAFRLKDASGHIYELSYKDLYNDYKALCTALIEQGFSGNKKIAIVGKNSYFWALSYLAAVTVGTVVPIDKELHVSEIINFLNIASCDAVIGDKAIIDKLMASSDLLTKKDILIVATAKTQDDFLCVEDLLIKGRELVDLGNVMFDRVKVDPDAAKILLFTSGTTGNAKGVCLSHHNLCTNMMSVAKMVKVSTKDTVLSILPLHHTYECTLGFLLILYCGGCISYTEGLRYITKNIQEFRPTLMIAVPLFLEKVFRKVSDTTMEKLPPKEKEKVIGLPFHEMIDKLSPIVRMIVKKKAKYSFGGKLHSFIVGAAAVDPIIIEGFGKLGIRVLQGYGLTECAPLLVGNNDFFMKPDSIGLAIHDVRVKIDEPDSSGVGEIIAKGDNIMLGYYNDEEATKAVIKDGWFHTGDLGYQDSDGWFYITGRRKNVIVTKNGKNIYPEELEYHLDSSDFVIESLVVGAVSKIDGSPCVKAKILPNIDAIKASLGVSELTSEQITVAIKGVITEINEKLPGYKRIKSFIIREKEFEKTSTQKIKRHGENIEDDEDSSGNDEL